MTDRGADDDALRAECAALRGERARLEARIAALEAQLASSRDEADRSHRLVVNITDNAPSVIYVKDLAGRFLLSNKLHAEFLGRTPGEVLGRQEGDFLSPDEAAEIAAVTERVVATRAIEVHEFRLTLDGTPHWFLEQVFPLVDDRGEPFAVGGISTDVTRRKLAEDEATLFRVLIERSPDPVCVAPYPLDLDAPLTYANAAATAAFGDESQVRAWLAERLSARAQARVEAALAGGQVWRAEWTRDDPSGEARSFDVSVFVVEKGGDERALAWMLRDVSEARRHTQERERLQESVINAQERVLAELSAPLMPVAANVLAVPVIGRYSRKRSLYLTEALTFGVTKHQARAVILDLTGLREIDEDTAATIQRLVAMIKLLGAHTVLTGVSAAVAQTLVRLEIDLVAQDVLIRPTMRAGIALALQLVKRRRDRGR